MIRAHRLPPEPAPALDPAERARYARHLRLPAVGEAGQRRLKAARVLLVGAGGLGNPAALYLAAAGVGHLVLVDFDRVERSNLQRQVLFTDADHGQPKATAAAAALRARNPHLTLTAHPERLTAANAFALAEGCDLILDGADNFATRYLTNDLAVLSGRPLVYAALAQFEGQASVFAHAGGPCYRCLYPEPPPAALAPDCATAGVLGVLPGLLGIIQATEALKLLLGIGEPLSGRLLTVDALALRFSELRLPRDPACPICGDAPRITDLAPAAALCAAPQSPWDLHPEDPLPPGPWLRLDVRSPAETAPDPLAGHHIPLPELEQRLPELPQGPAILVICATGQRSADATARLRAAGRAAFNLAGGLRAWRAVGRPLP